MSQERDRPPPPTSASPPTPSRPDVAALIADGNTDAARARLVALMREAGRRELRRHRLDDDVTR